MLFTCTSGKPVQGKKGSTLIIHTVFAGTMGQQVETRNIQGLLGHRSSSARGLLWQGASVCISNTLRGAERSRGREREGCWHPRPDPASPLAPPPGSSRCGGLAHSRDPRVMGAASPTPARPAAARQDGLRQAYGPDAGKLQRDLGPKFCPQEEPPCSGRRISLHATAVFFQTVAEHPRRYSLLAPGET